MFHNLIPLFADRFHLVAPDLPGFGLSEVKPRDAFPHTFDTLARVIGRFTEVIGLKTYALYVFDHGAPTGFRVAMAHPERVTAIVSQNGNAYEEGLSAGRRPNDLSLACRPIRQAREYGKKGGHDVPPRGEGRGSVVSRQSS